MSADLEIKCTENKNVLLNGLTGSGKSVILDILTSTFFENDIAVFSTDEGLTNDEYMKKLNSKVGYNSLKDARLKTIITKNLQYNLFADESSKELGSIVYKILTEHGITNIRPHFEVISQQNTIDKITISVRTFIRHGIDVKIGNSKSTSFF